MRLFKILALLAHRFFIFIFLVLSIFPGLFAAVVLLNNDISFVLLGTVLLVGACGAVFWHQIPKKIINLLIFNLISWPILLISQIFVDVLELERDTKTSAYLMLLVQCMVLCFGIIKYIYKKENTEKGNEDNEIQNQSSQALSEDEKEAIFFQVTLFWMLGKMAKADGQVSKDEIDAVEEIMIESEYDQHTRIMAIASFNNGKTAEVPFKKYVQSCRSGAIFSKYLEEIETRQYILYCLVKIAAADGVLHAIEEQYLNDVVTAFGLPPDILTQALEEEGILSTTGEYYTILGCNPSVSDGELKRRYRELSKQYHPDRISSKGLPPDFHKFAKEKFQEIQNAYEIITEHRK